MAFRRTWSSYGPPYPFGRWSSRVVRRFIVVYTNNAEYIVVYFKYVVLPQSVLIIPNLPFPDPPPCCVMGGGVLKLCMAVVV